MQVKKAVKTLAQQVTEFQEGKLYSLKKLASVTKVSVRTLERIKQGRGYNPHLKTLIRLSNAGVNTGNLLA